MGNPILSQLGVLLKELIPGDPRGRGFGLREPAGTYSLSMPEMDDTAAIESREWLGTTGASLCSRICPLCQRWSLVPKMVGRWAGPSGFARVTDSAAHT